MIQYVSKAWNDIITPKALINESQEIKIQLQFKTREGVWISAGILTTWDIMDLNGFLIFLISWFRSAGNPYMF